MNAFCLLGELANWPADVEGDGEVTDTAAEVAAAGVAALEGALGVLGDLGANLG